MRTKTSGASEGPSAPKVISKGIAELGTGAGKLPAVDEPAFKALVHRTVALDSSARAKPSKKATS